MFYDLSRPEHEGSTCGVGTGGKTNERPVQG
jgi:hypothetical protein